MKGALFLLTITVLISYVTSSKCSAGYFLLISDTTNANAQAACATAYFTVSFGGCCPCFVGYYCPGDDNQHVCQLGYTSKEESSTCQKVSCFDGDNEIQLEDGSYSKLIDLTEGDVVASWDPNSGQVTFSQIGFFALKDWVNLTLIQLCFTSGTCVSITSRHSVQLHNGDYIWAEDVTVGDIVVNDDEVESITSIQGKSLVAPILLDSTLLNVGKGNGVPIPIFGDLSRGMYGPQFQNEIFNLLALDVSQYCLENPSIYTILKQKDSHGCSLLATAMMDLIYNNNPTYWNSSSSKLIQIIVEKALAIKDLHSNNSVCFQNCTDPTPYCLDGICVECLQDSDCSSGICLESGYCGDINFDTSGDVASSSNRSVVIGGVIGGIILLLLLALGISTLIKINTPIKDENTFSLM